MTRTNNGAHNAEPFERRDIDFRLLGPMPRFWLASDCHRTRFYDAMSLMFPEGERAFIEAVQLHREKIRDNPELQREAAEFVAQEALHTREHLRYNAQLAAQGLPVRALEARVAAQQAFARRFLPPSVRLAITACLEHFTAMFADQLLRSPDVFVDACDGVADLWRWHALEEIEHKAVAFDVFAAAVPGSFRRYVMRCTAMLAVTLIFSTPLWRMTFSLVRCDGRVRDLRGWMRLLRDQLISPGTLTRMTPRWFAWFAPGFHPWQHDNRDLIRKYRPRFDAMAKAGSNRDSGE
ncbi:metal-dependent hydrolase [Caballeronia glebae]|uniref:Metal-dependent hydrolase n=1 Tax=Caballeronia glebae TaxID=1777143 RepID=A0A157Z0U5_9BURK|nr:metal-dependent hydrolase [Caballeronia glebae]SAK39111.1 metal-dependent hydrolase [Caballeronia glebae]